MKRKKKTQVNVSREEALVYSRENGGTLRFVLDKKGDLWVSHQDIKVRVIGKSSGDYDLETESDVA